MPSKTYPITLTFRDPALEADWWRHWAVERGPVVRAAGLLLLFVVASFSLVDVLAFPQVARTLLAWRLVVFGSILPAVIWMWIGDRPAKMTRWGQPFLAYLAFVVFAGLIPMGLAIRASATEDQLRVSVPSLLFGLIALYGVSGLRLAYAAPIGLLAVAGWFTVLAIGQPYDGGIWALTGVFAVGCSALGLTTCASLELFARRDFLRRRELEAERARSEALLRNIVPDALARRLEEGGGPLLERLDVTVLFATIADFEDVTRDLEPLPAVQLLDRIVAVFDDLARAEGVERIKTIGPTWMGASGVPSGREDHAEAAARLALAMRTAMRAVGVREGRAFRLRIGLSSGPVMAGVIGRTRYAFDVWGDTANTASRLDSHGIAGRIQVSASTAARLASTFALSPRGTIAVKGKGNLETWWLEP